MKIFNTSVYGIARAVNASGLPMRTDKKGTAGLTEAKDYSRARKLGSAAAGSGHDCFLKGITVVVDIEATGYWWQQFQRYHFADIVSSSSKMHRILKMDIENSCTKNVKPAAIAACKEAIKEHLDNPKKYPIEHVLDNVPSGLQLTATVCTNYLQLKSMYRQRKNHPLFFWRKEFCSWVASLPHAKDFGLLGE